MPILSIPAPTSNFTTVPIKQSYFQYLLVEGYVHVIAEQFAMLGSIAHREHAPMVHDASRWWLSRIARAGIIKNPIFNEGSKDD